MGKAPKPDLDEATVQIARRMLSTPPKPHEDMKVGARRNTKPTRPSKRRKSRKGVNP